MMHVAGRFTIALAALAAAAALAACEQDAAEPSADDSTPADTPPASPPTPPRAETVRRCRTAVYGDDPQRKGAVTAGPLTLIGYERKSRRVVERSGVVKSLALVKGGETVTLVVPEGERQRLSLLYDVSGRGPNRPLRLSDGTSSVQFNPCAQGEEWIPGEPYPDPNETQFNGGFFVRGAHCAPLEVWVEGQESPIELVLGFGTGDRPCPATSP